MRYLITGGAGFIGSHLVDYLINHNHETIIIDDFSTGFHSNLKGIDKNKLVTKKVQEISCSELPQLDGIFHLAAQASVPVSIDNFYLSSSNNLLSSITNIDLLWRAPPWEPLLSLPSSLSPLSLSLCVSRDTKKSRRDEDCFGVVVR